MTRARGFGIIVAALLLCAGALARAQVCTDDSGCPATAPVCSAGVSTLLMCGPCASDTVCSANHPGTPRCDTGGDASSGQCVACNNNVDCTDPAQPACADHACVACTGPGGCVGHTNSLCDTASDGDKGQCVACNSNTDCTDAAQPACTAHQCAPCSDPSGCVGHGPNLLCSSGGQCVQCLTAADCSASAPVCLGGACGGCSSSAECGRFPAAPTCNPVSGGCVVCTIGAGGDSTACATNPDGHQCQAGAAAGSVFCGCASDADCGPSTSGRICDGVTHRCVDGCARAAGRNGCPADRFCTSNSAAAGTCTVGCDFDPDCAAMTGLPFCEGGGADGGTDGGGGHCVGCRGNGDCGGVTPICDPSRQICVECTALSHAACSPGGAGAICLADGTCGCAVDADCGGASSGRICDSASHGCMPGCRSGGNGCPSGLVCDATGGATGTCVLPVVDDLGAPDLSVSNDLSVPRDLSVPLDAESTPEPPGYSPSGGGGCSLSGDGASAGLLLFALLLCGLWLARRRVFTR